MRHFAVRHLAALLLLAAAPATLAASGLASSAPGSAGPDSAPDVSVALFSARPVYAVTLTPLGPNAWTASCPRCTRNRLAAPLPFAGPGEIFAGGIVRVEAAPDGNSGGERQTRAAAGLWHLRATRPGGEIDVVLTLPSERYVAAVLNAEAAPSEPPESLRALAILARTYALSGTRFAAQPGHLRADLCDSTACQAMRLGPVSTAIADAVDATAGETLWFGPRRAEVFFSQSCGGLTEDASAVWPNLHGLPYLRSHPDPFCLRRDSAAWHTELPLTDFTAIARSEGWHVPDRIVAAHVAERSPSHRALRIVFSDSTGAQTSVAASALRFAIGRALGWDRVRSDAYDLGLRRGTLVFDGRGHGHGVGLCQTGAAEMAAEGSDARAILAFYLPGTVVRISPRDDGWHEARLGPLLVRFTGTLSPARQSSIQRTWDDAQSRFPPRHPVTPEVVFAPTTELFRQMTAQPGWVLASTRGTAIVLQPYSVLEAPGRAASGTLLHEMLHVLIEAEATDRAPLWLREGLAEVLAAAPGGPSPPPSSPALSPPWSAPEIDAQLTHADSQTLSERAHRAAAARVRASISRYGASAVRGWLSSGPPAGAA